MLVLVLEGLKAINEKYDLLEGALSMNNYPHEGAIFFFSISSKKVEEEVARQMEEEWKKKNKNAKPS
jgi:hypothetical protein